MSKAVYVTDTTYQKLLTLQGNMQVKEGKSMSMSDVIDKLIENQKDE